MQPDEQVKVRALFYLLQHCFSGIEAKALIKAEGLLIADGHRHGLGMGPHLIHPGNGITKQVSPGPAPDSRPAHIRIPSPHHRKIQPGNAVADISGGFLIHRNLDSQLAISPSWLDFLHRKSIAFVVCFKIHGSVTMMPVQPFPQRTDVIAGDSLPLR